MRQLLVYNHRYIIVRCKQVDQLLIALFQITGVNFTATDAIAMLQLCSYETHALGYSAFCNLFSEQDFLNYEYYYDLVSFPNNFPTLARDCILNGEVFN